MVTFVWKKNIFVAGYFMDFEKWAFLSGTMKSITNIQENAGLCFSHIIQLHKILIKSKSFSSEVEANRKKSSLNLKMNGK